MLDIVIPGNNIADVRKGEPAEFIDQSGLSDAPKLSEGLLDGRHDLRFSEVLVANLGSGVSTVASPDGSLRSIEVEEVLSDEKTLLDGEEVNYLGRECLFDSLTCSARDGLDLLGLGLLWVRRFVELNSST